MKKYLAAILAALMVLSLSVPAFAAETAADKDERIIVIEGASVLDDTPAFNTDITDATYEITHFDDRKNLDKAKLLELEDAYQNLYKRIGDNSCFTVYWFESGSLPIELVIAVEDIESYKSFSYQCWKDKDSEHPEYGKDWFEIKHEFDKEYLSVKDEKTGEEKHTVTLTIENNGPIAIISEYGAALGGFKHNASGKNIVFIDSVNSYIIPKKGDRSAESPTIITCDEGVTIVPYKDVSKDLGLLSDSQWEQFKEGYKQLKDQVPKDMTTRYVFYLIEEEPGTVVIRMDDIYKDDQVKVKVFNGSWQEQYHKVEEAGKVSFNATTSGFVAIFTQIEEA